MSVTEWDKLLRVGAGEARDVRLDCGVLIALGLVLIASGIGLRDPWPADEPRFALIARDMVSTGQWLIPRIGGDVYADKPPLYFWLIALLFEVTRSLRVAFLVPSLLSGIGCTLLVYDLARRLWNRETGLMAGLSLLFTVQFLWQVRQAQIDATLCFWTTLSLYGLLRHCLLGAERRWFVVGWMAAGLGIITKGVGFLPLLVLIPALGLRWLGWSSHIRSIRFEHWLLGALALLAAVSIWLVPMLLAARGNPELAAYRDEILFRQTLDRYANAWMHQEPFWYFIVEVIPGFWLPLSALVPWMVPRWIAAWRARESRVVLPLVWVVIVVLFFSASSGKRGLYVLPAVPALALACAPYLSELLQRRSVQAVLFTMSCAVPAGCAIAALLGVVQPEQRTEVLAEHGLDPLGPLLLMAVLGGVVCAWSRLARSHVAFAGVLTTVLLVVSFWVNPQMNAIRSGAAFVESVHARLRPGEELGWFGFREQYLLATRRPITHFGENRWRLIEGAREAADAALWLESRPNRALVVNDWALQHCFTRSERERLGDANRRNWYLVRGQADLGCAVRGNPAKVFNYTPPAAAR